jgi:hypothetical protein
MFLLTTGQSISRRQPRPRQGCGAATYLVTQLQAYTRTMRALTLPNDCFEKRISSLHYLNQVTLSVNQEAGRCQCAECINVTVPEMMVFPMAFHPWRVPLPLETVSSAMITSNTGPMFGSFHSKYATLLTCCRVVCHCSVPHRVIHLRLTLGLRSKYVLG